MAPKQVFCLMRIFHISLVNSVKWDSKACLAAVMNINLRASVYFIGFLPFLASKLRSGDEHVYKGVRTYWLMHSFSDDDSEWLLINRFVTVDIYKWTCRAWEYNNICIWNLDFSKELGLKSGQSPLPPDHYLSTSLPLKAAASNRRFSVLALTGRRNKRCLHWQSDLHICPTTYTAVQSGNSWVAANWPQQAPKNTLTKTDIQYCQLSLCS